MKMNENSKVTLTFGQLKRLVKESQDSQMTEDVAKYIADIVQKGLDKAYPGVKLIAYGDDYPHGIDMSNMNISNGKLDKEDERWLGINVKFPNIDDFPGSWTPNGLDIAVKVGSRPDDCDLMFGGWEPNDPKDTKGYYQDTVHRLQAAGYDMDNLTNNLKSIAGKAMDDAAEYVEDCYGEDAEYDYDPDAHYWPRRPAELAGVPSTPYPQRITLWEKEKSAADKTEKALSLKDVERKMDKALKYVGATKVDEKPQQEEAEMVFTKHKDFNFLQYNLWLYKNPARKLKGYAVRDNGSRIALALYFSVGKDDKLAFHGHLGYSNGISTTNVFSNAPRGMWYNFKYGEPETFRSLFDMMSGSRGTDFYECTPEMVENIVAGVEDLRYDKYDFKEALQKSRFTEVAWRKLCALIQRTFNVPNAY